MSRGRSALMLVALTSVLLVSTPGRADADARAAPPPHVDSLHVLMQEERFADVEERTRTRLAELEAAGPTARVEQIELLNLIVHATLSQKRHDDPGIRQEAEEALQLAEGLLGREDERTILALWNAARVAQWQDGGREATTLLERALAAAESPDADAEPLVAAIHGALGREAFATANLERATEHYERQLSVQERIFGGNHPELAQTLIALASVHRNAKRSDLALGLLDRAQQILDVSGAAGSADLARLLCERGFILTNRGEHATAKSLFSRAVELGVESLGPDDTLVSVTLIGLGSAQRGLGELDEAESALQRALAIQEKLHPRVRYRHLRETLNALSKVQVWRGDLVAARRTVERMIESIRETEGSSSMILAVRLLSYVEILRFLNLDAEARAAAEEAVAIVGEIEVSPAWRARINLELARVALDAGEPRQFDEIYREWYPVLEQALGADAIGALDWRYTRARALMSLGRAEEARTLLEQLLPRYDRALGPHAPRAANARTILAGLELGIGDPGRAAELFQVSLEGRKKIFGPRALVIAESLGGLSHAYARLGRYDDALESALGASAIRVDARRVVARSLSEREALAFGASRGLGVMLSMAAHGTLRDADSLSRVMDAVVRSRAVVLDELALRHRQATLSRDDQTLVLVSELRKARERLARLVVMSASQNSSRSLPAQLARARAHKEEAERALAERSVTFAEELRVERAGLREVAETLQPGDVLVSFVRYRHTRLDAAAPDAAPDEPRPARKGWPAYIALIITGPASGPIAVPLGDAHVIEDALTAWRRETSRSPGPLRPAALHAEQSYRRIATRLRELVWDPIAPHVARADRVILVPDGQLHLVSFSALPVGGQRYLVEDGPELVYLTSERDLLGGRGSPVGRGLLAMGGPSYDASPGAAPDRSVLLARRPIVQRPGPSTSGVVYRGRRSSCASFEELIFDALPHTSEEVREIAALWHLTARDQISGDEIERGSRGTPNGGGGPRGSAEVEARAAGVTASSPAGAAGTGARSRGGSARGLNEALELTGPNAHEELFKRLAPDYGVVHLATHGFFVRPGCEPELQSANAGDGIDPAATATGRGRSPGENPLLLSGLALAGANRRTEAGPEEEDGILTAEEIAALDLSKVDWVVLSACSSGVGSTMKGEGVFGLRRAFKIAGANALIMSLWPVEDSAARQWMAELYRARGEGLDAAAAARRASLSILKERRRSGRSAHPLYWGAFVAIH